MPELPEARRARFVAAYGIPEYDAGVLTQSGELASYFEAVVHAGTTAKAASNWVMGELLRTLKERGTTIGETPLAPQALAGLIVLVENGTLSSTTGKTVFAAMYDSGQSAAEIVAAQGLAQNSDEGALLDAVRAVMSAHPEAVTQIRAGKQQTFGFLVGQVMKQSGGKANPKVVTQILHREIARP
jgi:aspartyl-tRNA(Asn)/glutamyl-tRNA(Gln) amidotransferase subunit B